ncbi:hypothetical protein BAY60_05385 [Prauserella muralis]|uniref:Glycosyltransferase RgtA/B/C/D-like domain-containing protein n=1 Tax=Prauserella muralis TaxID=588067 RepID=A0A2V4B926_9PSEU|nr:hypothetical protein BAY60_05385 [Prauserella muralis]
MWPALALHYAVQAVSVTVLAVMCARADLSLAEVLGRYDGNWFAEIASHGYAQDVVVDAEGRPAPVSLAFFPLYPGLVAVFATVGVPVLAAELLVTLAAGGVAAWGLYVLGADVGGRRTGILLAGLWAMAPGSVVLHMGYSEALFVALAVWTLVALRGRQWLPAAGLTVLAGLTRSTAVALIAAVVVAAAVAVVRRRDGWRPVAAAGLAPLGLLAYLLYVGARADRLDGWFWLQNEAWYMGFDGGAFTWQRLTDAFGGDAALWARLVAAVVVAAVLFLLWAFTVPGLGPAAHVYTTLIVATALGTSAFWQSRPRFLLPAVVLGVPLALLLARLPTWLLPVLLLPATVAGAWFGGLLLTVVQTNP